MRKMLGMAAVALAVVALAGCCCSGAEKDCCAGKPACVCKCCEGGKCCCKDCQCRKGGKCCRKDAECGTAKAACSAGNAKQECPKK